MAGARAHFTYIWTIENVPESPFGLDLFSPVFTVKSMEMTKWRLWIDNNSAKVVLFLHRVDADDGPVEIEMEYELSFLGTDGLPLINIADTSTFKRSSWTGWLTIGERYDIFCRRRAQFLPKNALTVRCRMWRMEAETPLPDVCFARTRCGWERHCFVWAIKDFSSLTSGRKTTRLLKSTSEGAPQMTLIFRLTQYNGKTYISVDGNIEEGTSCWVNGEVALLDVDGTVVHSQKISTRFHSFDLTSLCGDFFEVQKLLSAKTTLLPNDVLSLRCQFEIGWYPPLWSGIENSETLESSVQQVDTSEVKQKYVEESDESLTGIFPFKQNVHRFYKDGTLSDVTLRAGAETFPVHKLVLSGRSPVFEAMFTSDMREKVSGCIDVPDVEPGTLRLLLSYIYTNEVPELQWDKAADLFRAADKYALLELKKQCSAILKSNLSRTNVCCVLTLADMHQEEEIRKAVLDFISKNLDIFSSEAWKIFKKENSELAMKTMETLLLKQC